MEKEALLEALRPILTWAKDSGFERAGERFGELERKLEKMDTETLKSVLQTTEATIIFVIFHPERTAKMLEDEILPLLKD